MTNYAKILKHQDINQIIDRLSQGDSVRDVSAWLKEKYPNDKDKHISHAVLDGFRREHLNVYGTVLEDIKNTIVKVEQEEINTNLREIIKKNKTYEEKLQEVVDTQIDYKVKLHQLMNVMETRFGQLFDLTQNDPRNMKPDKAMSEWAKNMLEVIREIRKIDGAPDQVIHHNVTVQAIDEQVSIFQQAFINTVSKYDIELASKIIDDFNNNIKILKQGRGENELIYSEKSMEKIDTIIAKVIPDDDKDKNGNK